MAGFVFFLTTLVGWNCCLADTRIKPEQIFRDTMLTQSNPEYGFNPTVTQTRFASSSSSSSSSGISSSAAVAEVSSFNNNNNAGIAGMHDQEEFSEHVQNLIAGQVLQFAHDIGQQLNDNARLAKSEVFSPLSVMSALALLLLGAKGKSYQELKQVFGIDSHAELSNDLSKFHEEFGNLLTDLQHKDANAQRIPNTKRNNWRDTSAQNNIRVPSAARNQPAEHIVRVANGLFLQTGYSLNPDYRYVTKSIYHTDLVPLDFDRRSAEARDTINAWVNEKTFGKIPSIINGEISKGTNVVMASALYFKGFWENPFFESATIKDNFYPDGPEEAPVKVNMMGTGGVFPFYDAVEYDCRIIGLPYKGNMTTMYVILPNHSTRDKLKQLQSFLDASKIEEMISKMSQKSAVVAFPKLHLMRSFNMRNILSRLGVNDIFSSSQSDLSLIGGVQSNLPTYAEAAPVPESRQFVTSNNDGIVFQHTPVTRQRSRRQVGPLINRRLLRKNSLEQLEAQRTLQGGLKSDLFVEDIVHKVDFDVNEHGTEAAAATLTYLRRSGTDVLFRADNPFLVLIRHDPTKLVLFYGIINEPEL